MPRTAINSEPLLCATSRYNRLSSITALSPNWKMRFVTTWMCPLRHECTHRSWPASHGSLPSSRSDRAGPGAPGSASNWREPGIGRRVRELGGLHQVWAAGPRAKKQNLCRLVPESVSSGLPTLRFEACPRPGRVVSTTIRQTARGIQSQACYPQENDSKADRPARSYPEEHQYGVSLSWTAVQFETLSYQLRTRNALKVFQRLGCPSPSSSEK